LQDMVRKRVLVTSFYNRAAIAPAIARLSCSVDVIMGNELGRSLTESEIMAVLPGMSAVIAAEEPYTCRVFDQAPELLMVARDGVGLDNIDLEAATRHGVVINNAPVVHPSVADLTFGLILAAVRKIVIGDQAMRNGRWTERDRFLSPDVHGKTLGLLGFGRIARAVARRASGFDMMVIAHDIDPDREAAERLGVRLVSCEDLLAAADILSVHLPLTPQTRGILSGDAISRMKDGVYLVNTSRGEVVDESALVQALRTGKIAGAGLDVVCHEPPQAGNPLFSLDNVVFTPHVGSDTCDTFLKVFESAVTDVLTLLAGDRPANIINPEVLNRRTRQVFRQGP
jgi:phosphoglycerate dehydrogenase-like enzyme